MMKFKFISFLMIFLSSLSSFAGEESGGHTGNGGGTIECPGKPSVVLDYYEAVQRGEKLLDVEKMPRDKFFKLMIRRLKDGGEQEVDNFINGFTGKGYSGNTIYYFYQQLSKAYQAQKTLDEWEEIQSWRVRDEFVDDNLPEGCHFEQAAISITIKNQPFRIKAITDQLSRGQKMILELHEFLNQINYAGTSMNVRQLVAVLLEKKPRWRELRAAVCNFADPNTNYVWKGHNQREQNLSDPKGKGGKWMDEDADRSGLYILDLRNKSADEKTVLKSCPRWVGIVPASNGNFMMQLFQDAAVESEDLVLPLKKIELLRKTIVSEYTDGNYRRGVFNKAKPKIVDWDLKIFSAKANSRVFEFQRKNEPRCRYLSVMENMNLFSKQRTIFEGKESMESDLFPQVAMMNDSFAKSLFVKRIRNYYEEKRLGMENAFESQIQAIRELMAW